MSCSLDSRTDLPKVRYATALDWFLLMSFFYCIATLLEFAGVHYFTKVGSGEIPIMNDDEWEDVTETIEHIGVVSTQGRLDSPQRTALARKRNSMICPIYNVSTNDRSKSAAFCHSNLFYINQYCQILWDTQQTKYKLVHFIIILFSLAHILW